MAEGALSGLLVLALEQAVAAPLCTVRLADAGARVIKIERPDGETARHYDRAVHGTSAYFAWLNRGKESAVLDLKAPSDMALFRRMLARADVLVQNLVPGAVGRLGLSAADLARDFPRLIGLSIVGYGQDTPYAAMRAYDLLVQAESGLCAVTGPAEAPCKVGVSAADIGTGMSAHAAILEALIARGRSGRGSHVEMAMFDVMADWMAVPLVQFEQAGRGTARHGLSHATIYPYRPFDCKDGRVIVAVQTQAEWARFCEAVLQRPELVHHPDFADNPQRVAHRGALDAVMEPVFALLTMAEATARLEAARIASGRLTEVADLGAHPALRRLAVRMPGGLTADLPRPAGRGPEFRPGPVPSLGAHTAAVRAEFAG